MASDPVLMHAANAVAASHRYGVPASVILGLLSVEGGTNADGTPKAPGDGAGPPSYGQFTYGTGRTLGIKYGDSKSEVDGVARYLVQLGYKTDPQRAIGAYNGGPGNPQAAYAAKVEAAAKRYVGFDGNAGAAAAASSSSASSSSSSTSSSASAFTTSPAQHSTLVRFGVTVGLVLAAVAAITVGAARATGVGEQLKRAAKVAVIA